MNIEKTVNAMDVRVFILKNELYTKGTCRDYDRLLIDLCGGFYEETTVEEGRIFLIVKDIFIHSDLEKLKEYYSEEDETEIFRALLYKFCNKCLHFAVSD